jgi:hypothetical protein
MSALAGRYQTLKNPHVVGLYNEGLPVAVHLSNALGCPMSIIRVVNDKAVWLLNLTGVKDIRPHDAPLFPRLIVANTVYDSGEKFGAVKQLPEFIDNPDYTFFAFFGCKNDNNVFYKYEQVYRNILFPWHGISRETTQKINV